jgi:hypothetical protein
VTLAELQRTRAKQVQSKPFSELMGKRRQVIFLAFSLLMRIWQRSRLEIPPFCG